MEILTVFLLLLDVAHVIEISKWYYGTTNVQESIEMYQGLADIHQKISAETRLAIVSTDVSSFVGVGNYGSTLMYWASNPPSNWQSPLCDQWDNKLTGQLMDFAAPSYYSGYLTINGYTYFTWPSNSDAYGSGSIVWLQKSEDQAWSDFMDRLQKVTPPTAGFARTALNHFLDSTLYVLFMNNLFEITDQPGVTDSQKFTHAVKHLREDLRQIAANAKAIGEQFSAWQTDYQKFYGTCISMPVSGSSGGS